MTGQERRRARRWIPQPGEAGAILQFRRGGEARVLNLSHGGALLEGVQRLEPGRSVEASFQSRHGPVTVRALVVRASVAGVRAEAITYLTAVQFDRPTLV